jgi:colanic acid biosynthesis glycosyl transferase WcaI
VRIVVHDYSGHPFQVQLSRELATRGHQVDHWYCSSYATGHGDLTTREGDPEGLSITPVPMASPFQRYSPLTRLRQEVSYGRAVGRSLATAQPDVVVFCNTPLLAHAVAARHCRSRRLPMVFWHQDVYSAAIATAATARLGAAGRLVGRSADMVERSIARRSRAIVAISDEFLSTLDRWGVRDRTTVIPNWAPLQEIPVRRRDNEWARARGLVGRPVVLYSGTLGVKHDPAILLDMARALKTAYPDGRVVVISEGLGRDWLAQRKAAEGIENLVLLDYQPYQTLPDVLGSAEVLVAILEASAGRYSVPSKILTYLCASRPILAVIPADNAAASTLRSSGGGIVVSPSDRNGAVRALLDLLGDRERRSRLALAGRKYAEEAFDVRRVGDRFERILFQAAMEEV